MKCGIYCITNEKNGRVYVGQSRNIPVRWSAHRRACDADTSMIAKAIKKHGLENFRFKVLEPCQPHMLDERERHYIKKLQSMYNQNGYNIESGGNTGEKISPLISQRKRGKNNPMYGKKVGAKTRRAMSLSSRGSNNKLTEPEVRDVKTLLLDGAGCSELAERYSVSYHAIHKIMQVKNWEWVLPELNAALINLTDDEKKKRDAEIKELWEKGKYAAEIARMVNCSEGTVKRVVGTSRLKEAKERYQNMIDDYENGLSRDAIQERYGVRRSAVNRALQGIDQRRRAERAAVWVGMRRRGVTVQTIAAMYGVNKGTVTEHTKGR